MLCLIRSMSCLANSGQSEAKPVRLRFAGLQVWILLYTFSKRHSPNVIALKNASSNMESAQADDSERNLERGGKKRRRLPFTILCLSLSSTLFQSYVLSL